MSTKNIDGDLLSAASGTEAGAIIDALEHVDPARVKSIGVEGVERNVLVVREGYEVHELKPLLDKYRTAPERRKGTASLDDLASFVAHVKRFADEDSAVFADRSNIDRPALEAVLDYHRQTASGAPRFGEHRARYEFPLSEEWVTWRAKNGKSMAQAEFAAFLEGRVTDLDGEPGPAAIVFASKVACDFATPSRLIALSRGLGVREDARVVNAQVLASGETQMVFETTHQTYDKDGGPITVPGAFLIAIPVFRRGPAYQIPAKLRYRKQDSKIVWWFELHRLDSVFDHAFDEACDSVRAGTGLPLFLGRSER
jgi:uncharacterized protein YfdQ (DUF2303 family)